MTLNAPWKTPMSSPMRKTRSSRLHLLAQRLVERLAVAHHRHGVSRPPPSRRAGRPSLAGAVALGLALPALARLAVAHAGVGGAGLGQLVRHAPGLALALAAVRLGRALVHRPPAAHLLAEHVEVVVERVELRERRLCRRTRTASSTVAIACASHLLAPPRRRSRPRPRAVRRSSRSGRARATPRPPPWCGTPRGRPSSARGSGRSPPRRSCGWRSSRALRSASVTAACTSSTSMPSHRDARARR